MEGTQFYGLFGMILSLYRQGKLPGVGTMFRYTLRDESNHIELFRRLLLELVDENPEIWTPAFREELRALMAEAVALEKRFIARLPAGRGRRPVRGRVRAATSTTSPTVGWRASGSSRSPAAPRTRCRGSPS